MSLLSVANSGEAQMRAVSLWGAAAAVGAAAGPLVGGVLVDVTGWQGLFWIDAAVAAGVHAAHAGDGERVARPGASPVDRLRRDRAGGADADAVDPRGEQERRLGLVSAGTLGCSGSRSPPVWLFVVVERRIAVPLLDLALLRNRVLVGSTIAILIGAGTINGLMYLLSLYFQDPALPPGLQPARGRSGHAARDGRAGGGGPVRVLFAAKIGGRQTIGLGFALTAASPSLASSDSWKYSAFLLPLVAIAVGMGIERSHLVGGDRLSPGEPGGFGVRGLEHGPVRRSAAAIALAATIYGNVISNSLADGEPQGDALASGLAAASWLMAVFTLLGVLMALVIARHRAATGTMQDAAAAAAVAHTLPTRQLTGRVGTEQAWSEQGGRDDHDPAGPPAPFTNADYAARMRTSRPTPREAGLVDLPHHARS